jgi:hypothetical protein
MRASLKISSISVTRFIIVMVLFVSSAKAQGAPHYVGDLVLSPNPDGLHMKLLRDYSFVDSKGQNWPVPSGMTTDGASIPQVFWSLVGGPYEGKYRNAAIIHDWYCDVRTRPWHDVDRMFYEAMLTSGVDDTKAKIMYLAVVFGGPRWNSQTTINSNLAYNIIPPSQRPPKIVPIDSIDKDRGPINITPPNATARLQNMLVQVSSQGLSPDQIDRLAEQDPENIKIIVSPQSQ